MEALSVSSRDDSMAGINNLIKDDDEDTTPPHPPEEGRVSTPPDCAICLGQCKNKSFTDSCLHQFCFNCLLTWSKIKAECPLCKQTFKSIIHNVRSNHQYEEYLVEQRQTEEIVTDLEPLNDPPRFRYRTTLTLHRRESIAIQRLLLRYPLVADALPTAPGRPRTCARPSFRRTVYRHNLWARPLLDVTGRYRQSTPEVFRYNPALIHRLVPWLTRELAFLLNDNHAHIAYVVARITDLLPTHAIVSPVFRAALAPYLGTHTDHFLHELQCFAASPYDVTGYDRTVQYAAGGARDAAYVDEVISTTDSDDSADSDIVMVSSAGPSSRATPSALVASSTAPAEGAAQNLDGDIAIETISQSDSDDSSSEVIVVGYIKPPQDRTPEVVDLLASDSDVVLQENSPAASTSRMQESLERPSSTPLVKLSLKRQRAADFESDSDFNPLMEIREKRKRRPRTKRPRRRSHSDSGSGSSTCSCYSTAPSASTSTTTSVSYWSSTSSERSPSINSSSSCEVRRPKRSSKSTHGKDKNKLKSQNTKSDRYLRKHRPKKAKDRKAKSVGKERPRKKSKRTHTERSSSKLRSGRREHREKRKEQRDLQKVKTKSKARSRKDVKSSKVPKRETSQSVERPAESPELYDLDRPGTSGMQQARRSRTLSNGEEPKKKEDLRGTQRDKRKLKSVVNIVSSPVRPNVMPVENGNSLTEQRFQNVSPAYGDSLLDIMSNAILNPHNNVLFYNSDSASPHYSTASGQRGGSPLSELVGFLCRDSSEVQNMEPHKEHISVPDVQKTESHDSFDSDDDVPLNLSIKKETDENTN